MAVRGCSWLFVAVQVLRGRITHDDDGNKDGDDDDGKDDGDKDHC